jgi:hypothetical protein
MAMKRSSVKQRAMDHHRPLFFAEGIHECRSKRSGSRIELNGSELPLAAHGIEDAKSIFGP